MARVSKRIRRLQESIRIARQDESGNWVEEQWTPKYKVKDCPHSFVLWNPDRTLGLCLGCGANIKKGTEARRW